MQYAKCLFWWETKRLFSGKTSSGTKRIYQLKILNMPRKQWLIQNKSDIFWWEAKHVEDPTPLVIISLSNSLWQNCSHCNLWPLEEWNLPGDLRSGISLVTWGAESPWWPYLVHFVLRVDSLGQGLSVLGLESLDPHRWIPVITRPGHHVGKEQARQCC